MQYGFPYRPNPGAAPQKVSYGVASAACGTPFSSQTYVVRLVASTDCYVQFGQAGVTAASTGMFVKANWSPEYFVVSPGQSVAAIRDSADGTLFITEMTR